MNEHINLILDYYPDLDFLTADGFDSAIIGVSNEKLVYSRSKCIDILKKRDGMTELDAMEFFDFNVEGAYMGKKTPIWVNDTMF